MVDTNDNEASEMMRIDDATLAEADAVGHRLRACVSDIIRRTTGVDPSRENHGLTAKNLAKITKTDQIIAKKLLRLASAERTGADITAQAPKPVQLLKVAQHLEHRKDALNLSDLELWPLRDAIKKLDRLIAATGGSKMELTRALRATLDRDDTEPEASAPSEHSGAGGLLLLGEDGVIATVDGERWGVLAGLSPLRDADATAEAIESAAVGEVVILDTDAAGIADADENDPDGFLARARAWSSDGSEDLLRALEPVARRASERGVRVLIRPTASGVLSDVQRAVNVARRAGWGGREGVALALDPLTLVAPGMVEGGGVGSGGGVVRDYAGRAVGVLGAVSGAVIVRDGVVEGGEVRGVAWGEGLLGVGRVLELAREHAGAAAVVVAASDWGSAAGAG